MARLTVKNRSSVYDSGTYRLPMTHTMEFRILDNTLFGTMIDKLGMYEDIGEPEDLKRLALMYKNRK